MIATPWVGWSGMAAVGERIVDVMIIVISESQLLQVVLALSSPGCLASLLHGWQQQCNQNRNDCYHD